MSEYGIAELIKAYFKNNKKSVGESVPIRLILSEFNNLREKELIPSAIQLLQNEGVIKTRLDIMKLECLFLTPQGFESLYDYDKDVIVPRICADILQGFVSAKIRPGEALPESWINHYFSLKLDPGEKRYFDEAFDSLATDGFIDIEKDTSPRKYILKQKGFEHIYPT